MRIALYPPLLSSVVVVVIVVVVIVVIVVIVVVVVDIDHIDAYPSSNAGGFYHDVNHQPEKQDIDNGDDDDGEYKKGYKRESEVNHDIDAGGGKGEEGKDTGCVICTPLQKAFQSSATLFLSPFFTSTIFFR